MSEWKKVLLNLYLIFKFVIFILWVIVGTALYLFLLFFSFPDDYPESQFHHTNADFFETFFITTGIYIIITFSAINSIQAVNKIINLKTLNVINYISLIIMAISEILLITKGLIKL